MSRQKNWNRLSFEQQAMINELHGVEFTQETYAIRTPLRVEKFIRAFHKQLEKIIDTLGIIVPYGESKEEYVKGALPLLNGLISRSLEEEKTIGNSADSEIIKSLRMTPFYQSREELEHQADYFIHGGKGFFYCPREGKLTIAYGNADSYTCYEPNDVTKRINGRTFNSSVGKKELTDEAIRQLMDLNVFPDVSPFVEVPFETGVTDIIKGFLPDLPTDIIQKFTQGEVKDNIQWYPGIVDIAEMPSGEIAVGSSKSPIALFDRVTGQLIVKGTNITPGVSKIHPLNDTIITNNTRSIGLQSFNIRYNHHTIYAYILNIIVNIIPFDNSLVFLRYSGHIDIMLRNSPNFSYSDISYSTERKVKRSRWDVPRNKMLDVTNLDIDGNGSKYVDGEDLDNFIKISPMVGFRWTFTDPFPMGAVLWHLLSSDSEGWNAVRVQTRKKIYSRVVRSLEEQISKKYFPKTYRMMVKADDNVVTVSTDNILTSTSPYAFQLMNISRGIRSIAYKDGKTYAFSLDRSGIKVSYASNFVEWDKINDSIPSGIVGGSRLVSLNSNYIIAWQNNKVIFLDPESLEIVHELTLDTTIVELAPLGDGFMILNINGKISKWMPY